MMRLQKAVIIKVTFCNRLTFKVIGHIVRDPILPPA